MSTPMERSNAASYILLYATIALNIVLLWLFSMGDMTKLAVGIVLLIILYLQVETAGLASVLQTPVFIAFLNVFFSTLVVYILNIFVTRFGFDYFWWLQTHYRTREGDWMPQVIFGLAVSLLIVSAIKALLYIPLFSNKGLFRLCIATLAANLIALALIFGLVYRYI